MVTNVTSLTGNGLKDWLIQRVSAVYFGLYCLFVFSFVFIHADMTFSQWQSLFHNQIFKIASIVALFTFFVHTWIGIWTVTTDYVKCTAIRLSVQLFVALILLVQLIWGIEILWGQ